VEVGKYGVSVGGGFVGTGGGGVGVEQAVRSEKYRRIANSE